MKTMRLFGLLLASLFLVSLVSASSTYTVQHDYYNDDGSAHIKTVYYTFDKHYQENENRYPVYDYRDGYTYRISKEYLEQKYDNEYSRTSSHKNSNERGRSSNEITYYDYVPYMRAYEEKTCYNSAPHGKLFYINCDF